jgi:hypothetical protein
MAPLHRTLGIFAVLALWPAAAVHATGYWNMPGTFCQCMGVGWGAGYHAPLLLGPATCAGWCDHKEVRLPHSPAPLCGCYRSCGCDGNAGQPSRLEAVVSPPSTPAPVPVTAIFAPPVER